MRFMQGSGDTVCARALVRGTISVVVALGCFGARPANATVKPEISLRSGYGVPLGGTDSKELSQTVAGQVPLWLDLGARIAERFFVGAYAQYSFSFLGSEQAHACRGHDHYVAHYGGSSSCQIHGQRVGVELLFHPRPAERFDPWLGLGTGYEWLTLTEPTTGITLPSLDARNRTVKVVSHGFEVVNVQFGLDAVVVDRFAVGPFVALTFASYRRSDGSCSGDCRNTVVVSHDADDDFHRWFYFGLRATYVF